MLDIRFERKYQTPEKAVAGFNKIAPAKEFADVFFVKDLYDLHILGVSPFTALAGVEYIKNDKGEEIGDREVHVYILKDATGEVWMRSESHVSLKEELKET